MRAQRREAGGTAEDLVPRPLHVCPAGNSEDFKVGIRVRMDLDLGNIRMIGLIRFA